MKKTTFQRHNLNKRKKVRKENIDCFENLKESSFQKQQTPYRAKIFQKKPTPIT
jgi:hypothetical protein